MVLLGRRVNYDELDQADEWSAATSRHKALMEVCVVSSVRVRTRGGALLEPCLPPAC